MSMPGYAPGHAEPHRLGKGRGEPLFTHVIEPLEVPDVESEPVKFVMKGILALRKEMQNLARQVDNRSRPVDEYRVQSLTADSELVVTVPPQYDFINERIENIMITGPAGNVTLQVGDRTWPLQIPATGYIHIGPLSLLLARNDTRQLVAASAGDYSLELMGWADERY